MENETCYLVGAASAIAGYVLALLLGLGPVVALGFALSGGLLLPHLYVGTLRQRRFKRFSNEFANAINVIVRGLIPDPQFLSAIMAALAAFSAVIVVSWPYLFRDGLARRMTSFSSCEAIFLSPPADRLAHRFICR